MQNASIESFDSRLRDECLNEHVFLTLAEARETVEVWRHDYNHLRPHASLGALTPAEFATLKGLEEQPPPGGGKWERTLFMNGRKLGCRPLLLLCFHVIRRALAINRFRCRRPLVIRDRFAPGSKLEGRASG